MRTLHRKRVMCLRTTIWIGRTCVLTYVTALRLLTRRSIANMAGAEETAPVEDEEPASPVEEEEPAPTSGPWGNTVPGLTRDTPLNELRKDLPEITGFVWSSLHNDAS